MGENSIAIRTNCLTKRFGKRIAVDALNIEIRQGEIFSLLGTNGAGKTTTIRMLCCLLNPTSGTATVMGYDIKDNPFQIKNIIGVSPQETAVASHLSTKENLRLMGGVFGLQSAIINLRAKNLMELMELEDRKDQVRKLSGGMQRRLSIAMALMSDPQILFLDEPTLGLDPHARKSVWNYINKLKRKKTILLTTHYLEEADSLADQIAIMDNSKIISSGSSNELKQKHLSIKTLKITVDNIPHDVSTDLKKLGLNFTLNDTIIEIKSVEIDIYKIINYLQSKSIIIKGIQMKEPTLEEVFLLLTSKEVKNENI
jgi:ABC-2 type transport system ATP-binding protein